MDWMIDALAILDLHQVQGWMEAGGYIVLFGLLCACGLGLPLPEDIPLLLAGALVSRGNMDLVPAGICAWGGIIGGDCILYFLSRKYGMGITRVPLVGRHITPARVERVGRLFERYGAGVVAVCRLFAGLRAAMVAAAGITRYGFLKFVIADAIAALFSGGLFIALGYWFGTRLEWLMGEIKQWQHVILGVVIGAAIAGGVWYVLWRRRQHMTLTEAALIKATDAAGGIKHHLGAAKLDEETE